MKVVLSSNSYSQLSVTSFTRQILALSVGNNYESFLRDTVLNFYKYVLNSQKTHNQKTMTMKYSIPNSKLQLQLKTYIQKDFKNDAVTMCHLDTKLIGLPKQIKTNLQNYITKAMDEVLEETLLS
jgi:hypothetical protein